MTLFRGYDKKALDREYNNREVCKTSRDT